MSVPDQFSADEIRAALVLTRRAAEAQFWLAHDLVARLPQVHAAMMAGILDEPRARVFSEWTTELSPEQARDVCATLLPRAPELTTGQLIDLIKKLAIAVDPDWARRRYEQALAERKVVGSRNTDGSANLSGYNLPVDRVAAACGRIDALAKAAKRAGDLRPIDHIRAELFLGMTDGTYAGLDNTTILELLRDQVDAEAGTGRNDGDGETGAGGPDQEPSAGEADGKGPNTRPTPLAWAGVELRVRLSTLLGHDQYPAEVAGWGPVHAELARDLAAALGAAQWRFVVTDEHGHPIHCGTTRARPAATAARATECGAIVELQVPATVLHTLTAEPDTLGGWAAVVADLTRQLAADPRLKRGSDDPARRAPGAALRRYLEIRDRFCIMIGCRVPAHGTDADRTRDYAFGGAKTGPNLGTACRHDHRLKGEGGWTLHQPEPGVFQWTSRLGHTYCRRLPRIIEPLLDPVPRAQAPYPIGIRSDDNWENTQIWEQTLNEPEVHPPPEINIGNDPPPF
ncbi:MAG: HNH endonuclease [Pseudonocardia sp.]|nr:HNH endonuclease [Pseudonocardia sp.]